MKLGLVYFFKSISMKNSISKYFKFVAVALLIFAGQFLHAQDENNESDQNEVVVF